MHDCPACRVPLHGYEEVCPSCGAKQYARKRSSAFGSAFKSQEPGINWIPIVLAVLGVGVVLLCAVPNTWIGQLMKEGKREESPLEKMTTVEARNIIESELTKNLTAVGAKADLKWQAPGGAGEADRNADIPVELTVSTALQSPDLRRQIVDPIKPYMEKGKVYTLTMTDSRSHATWTYNVQPNTAPVDPDAGLE